MNLLKAHFIFVLLFSTFPLYSTPNKSLKDLCQNKNTPQSLDQFMACELSVDASAHLGSTPTVNPAELVSIIEVRTGGSTVYCKDKKSGTDLNSPLSGFYTLDYFANRDSSKVLKTPKNLEESLLRILALLNANAPLLRDSLSNFILAYQNPENNIAGRMWWPVSNIKNLDADILNNFKFKPDAEETNEAADLLTIPKDENCYVQDVDGKARLDLRQAIIRRKLINSNRTIYIFDKNILSKMEPTQLSLLLIHEWLWDFYHRNQINDLWTLNYLLHSESIIGLSQLEFWDLLKQYNIPLSYLGARPVANDDGELALAERFSCLLFQEKVRCWGSYDESMVKAFNLTHPKNLVAFNNAACVIDENKIKCWGSADDDHYYDVSDLNKIMGSIREPQKLIASHKVICAQSPLDDTVCYNVTGKALTILSNPAIQDFWDDGDGGMLITRTDKSVTVYESKYGNIVNEYPSHSLVSIAAYSNTYWFIDQNLVLHNISGKRMIDINQPYQVVANRWGVLCARNDQEVKCEDSIGIASYVTTPPVLVSPQLLAAGDRHFCALDQRGVKCWGDNRYGQTSVPKDLYPLITTK